MCIRDRYSRFALALAEDEEERLWIGTDRGLYCHERGKLRQVYPAAGAPDVRINAVVPDVEGALYFGSWGSVALARYDGEQVQPVLAQGDVSAIARSRTGGLWVGLGNVFMTGHGTGIARVDRHGKASVWTMADGLLDDRVRDVAEDE